MCYFAEGNRVDIRKLSFAGGCFHHWFIQLKPWINSKNEWWSMRCEAKRTDGSLLWNMFRPNRYVLKLRSARYLQSARNPQKYQIIEDFRKTVAIQKHCLHQDDILAHRTLGGSSGKVSANWINCLFSISRIVPSLVLINMGRDKIFNFPKQV